MDLFGSLFAIVAMIICCVIWVLPILLIGASDQTFGKEKFAWVLAVIFISWFAWIFYLLLAPINKKHSYEYRR